MEYLIDMYLIIGRYLLYKYQILSKIDSYMIIFLIDSWLKYLKRIWLSFQLNDLYF